jgi:hypothetical protein
LIEEQMAASGTTVDEGDTRVDIGSGSEIKGGYYDDGVGDGGGVGGGRGGGGVGRAGGGGDSSQSKILAKSGVVAKFAGVFLEKDSKKRLLARYPPAHAQVHRLNISFFGVVFVFTFTQSRHRHHHDFFTFPVNGPTSLTI